MEIEIFKPGNIIEKKPKRQLIGFKVYCNKCGCGFIMPLECTHKITTMTFWQYAWNCPWCSAHHETGQGGDNGYTEYLYEGDV